MLGVLACSLAWGVQGQAETIAGGYKYSMAMQGDGTVRTWGSNGNGQLGDGTTTTRSTPTSIGLSNISAIAAGGRHSLALKDDGTVWAWGANGDGQLGSSTSNPISSPVQLEGLGTVTAIAAGYYHSMVLLSDGTIRALGSNYYGQLGDTTNTSSSMAVPVYGLTDVAAIAAGYNHSLALKEDGTVWAWGWNYSGELGGGFTSTSSATPVLVSGVSNIVAIDSDAGYGSHSLALKNDGTVWAWGANSDGQLGDGTTTQRTTPVQVSGLTNVMAIAAGGDFSLALKTDGTVWAFGGNSLGQLGNGSTQDSAVPVQVSGLSGVTAITAGGAHGLAVTADGVLWAWGRSSDGQLGLGDSIMSSDYALTPRQVGSGYLVASSGEQAPAAPSMQVQTSGQRVTVSWSGSTGATEYTLFYAPYPNPTYIGSAAMGSATTFSIDLWSGAAFYVAVAAGNSVGSSGYSNIGYFVIP
ncbi:MAG: RCC1 domain-containing protein [Thermodesulfobacteriota bacterium]